MMPDRAHPDGDGNGRGGATTETPLRRLVAYVHDENVASCRLLARLGFTREGLLREHYVIEGVPANEVVFGLLRREWPLMGGTP